ncbi:RNA recognition motif domain-containing protein [Sunxiuqinia elliptica]|uniref:RNA recognition motif-containing protein n=1 Tax=Sunxiuqinia elliptica TaxID=655355 RepID=A0A1I2H3H4_9BACT|nr:RNA-binding protein [Sunxiuqinia elliptica]TDN99878.1 RNA recognition motif-containing protein [Sunxiuqinia elliptica]TDO57070.1 RNA recognition motif-containing protein [Sunxiuqinia elliptica]SFF23879.1 RNA recognition motif. (a.k.a. RRM, RBD, or RNP domain) [Sunxiuqinia elliptica]
MNIYVGNLDYNLGEDELGEIFAEYGEVVSVKIVKDRETGRAKGFGFVEMAVEAEGDKAVEELDGAEVNGRNIKVNKARPRPERPPRRDRY